jgi:hypothetical protein
LSKDMPGDRIMGGNCPPEMASWEDAEARLARSKETEVGQMKGQVEAE